MTKTKTAAALEAAQTAAQDLASNYRELLFVTTYYSNRGYSTHGYKVWGVNTATGQLDHLTYTVATAAGVKVSDRHGEIRVTGCGYDKVHHLMSNAAHTAGRTVETMPAYRQG